MNLYVYTNDKTNDVKLKDTIEKEEGWSLIGKTYINFTELSDTDHDAMEMDEGMGVRSA